MNTRHKPLLSVAMPIVSFLRLEVVYWQTWVSNSDMVENLTGGI
jgi:hypothetical protein